VSAPAAAAAVAALAAALALLRDAPAKLQEPHAWKH
jgi:hypothetical protein